MGRDDSAEADAKLEAERSLARRLRKECLRLSRELSAARRENEQLTSSLRAVLASWTWRVAVRLNRLAARLLGVRRGPPAWEHLAASLDSDERDTAASALDKVAKRDSASRLYAGQATDGAGLYRAANGSSLLAAPAAPAQRIRIRCVSEDESWLAPSVPGCEIVCARAAGELDLDSADALLVVVGTRSDAEQLETILRVAGLSDLPCAAVGAGRELDRCARTVTGFDLTASLDGEDGGKWMVVSTPLEWGRFLHELCVPAAGREQEIEFVGSAYLAENPDVARAIEQGAFQDAQDHWSLLGREEFIRGYRSFRRRAQRVSMGLRQAGPEERRRAAEEIETWDQRPLISVLVPIHRVDVDWLRAAVESVINQLYPIWELCLVDDGSGDLAIRQYLESLDDSRIKLRFLDRNRGIAAATNQALEMATGDYLGLLDHDDELSADALWLVARVIRDFDPDLIYSDEAKLDLAGQVVEPHFKPDFSREMILSQNYISHFGVYRRSIVGAIGGFREGYEGSQDHDLLLRFLARARSVFHTPRILYYWRKVPRSTASRFGEKDYAWDSGVRALEDLQRHRANGAGIDKGLFPGTYHVRYRIDDEPQVSILVPFRDKPELLDQCLSSLLEKTEYTNFEFIGIDNASRKKRTAATMERWRRRDRRVRFIEFDAPFNFSAINNFGAEQARGEHLLLLNNDISVIEPGWLTALLEFSQSQRIGAVGGLLLYPDDTIQHAGVILGIGGVAGHSHKYFPATHHGYFCRPHLIQNVSAVTGACMMVERGLYLTLGGLDEDHLSIAFNDIDFCLRLRERGLDNVYTPYCRLYHHESKSRGHEDTPQKQRRFAQEVRYMRNRHGLVLSSGDPFYNPNLTLVCEDFSIREG